MKIKFYKDPDGRWYADLPEYLASGGCKEDCEMVAGADSWLDIISQGENNIELRIDDKSFFGAEELKLEHTDKNMPEFGAIYRIQSYQGIDYSANILWLCNVTLFLFPDYPQIIYYK